MIQYYEFGNFRIDVAGQRLLKDGEPLPLTQKTFEILLFLAKNSGEILRKQDFFNSVWSSSFVDESNLTQHIYRIRKILSHDGTGKVSIETIPKLGYRFVADINEISFELQEESSISAPEWLNNPSVIEETRAQVNNVVPAVSEVSIDQGISISGAQVNNSKLSLFSKSAFVKAGLVLIVVLVHLSYIFLQPLNTNPEKTTVAVFPFRQIGKFRDNKLQDGIAETVTSNFGKIENVTIVPTDSVLLFSGNNNSDSSGDLFEIGRKLKTDIILTGTIQRDDNSVRVNVQFYHVNDRKQICTAKFDEEFSDIFTLQDDISTKVTSKLIKEFSHHDKPSK